MAGSGNWKRLRRPEPGHRTGWQARRRASFLKWYRFFHRLNVRAADFPPPGRVLQWKKMLRFALPTLLAAVAFAQNPADPFNRPPAGVDQALRARIHEFFQYHVTQEFRKAEKVVAEDSQDF